MVHNEFLKHLIKEKEGIDKENFCYRRNKIGSEEKNGKSHKTSGTKRLKGSHLSRTIKSIPKDVK